jgi:uncharacterized damage-inducible protein DinB
MLGKAMMESLLAYDAWAMEKLLEQAAGLTQEQLDAPTQYGRGSIRAILFHSVGAMELWSHVLARGAYPSRRRRLEEHVTVEDLRAYASEINAAGRAALAQFDEEQLAETITVPDPRGNARRLARWHMLVQPLTHAMQHRAEVAAELTRLGRSPGDLDFVFAVMSERHSSGAF